MASVGWAGACPNGIRARSKASARRGIFSKRVPCNHDARSSPGPMPQETVMRFYRQPHAFYSGVDLHASTPYLCFLDQADAKLQHRDVPSEPAALLEALAPSRSCGLGNERATDPAERFGAAPGCRRGPEIVPAAVRTVKLSTSYCCGAILSPSGARPLDGGGRREVRLWMLPLGPPPCHHTRRALLTADCQRSAAPGQGANWEPVAVRSWA
jgi:hypothetical protein